MTAATVDAARGGDVEPGQERLGGAHGAIDAMVLGPADAAAAAVNEVIAGAFGWRVALEPAIKRTFDVVVSLAVLALMLPIMLVVAVAIMVESPGPVFYRASRVGRGGRNMLMFKFRKMARDATGLKLTTGNDARLTRVGAFLTRSKLDELPQFLNVLRGEMSLIGPRPEDPGFVTQRQADYDVILRVRPGITGLSQVAFADESRILSEMDPLGHYLHRIFPQKCALDRLYVASRGLRTDLRIMLWTLMAVLLRREVAVHRATGRMNLRRRIEATTTSPREDSLAVDAARHDGERHLQLDIPRLREHAGDTSVSYDGESVGAPTARVPLDRADSRFDRRPG